MSRLEPIILEYGPHLLTHRMPHSCQFCGAIGQYAISLDSPLHRGWANYCPECEIVWVWKQVSPDHKAG